MLHEFIALYRDAIISCTRERVAGRTWPSVSQHGLENGVPLFLSQLSETLRLQTTDTPFPSDAIGATAKKHGGELLKRGFNVSQVVHYYGDICQAITQIAVEQNAPLTVDEFNTLNRCLDDAIAEAVTEHARITAETRVGDESEHLGNAAHELQNTLNTAILAFHALKEGAVGIKGNTGAILGRSLVSLQHIISRSLSQVRLAAGKQWRERLLVLPLVDEIAASAMLESQDRNIKFTVEPVDASLAVSGDPHLLTSAVINLLQNAFKYTPSGGCVVLRAYAKGGRLVVEIEDECGGIPESKADLFEVFGDRCGRDHSGLGLGLSIARETVRAHEGDILIRNMPGKGCVFVIDLPLAAGDVRAFQPVRAPS